MNVVSIVRCAKFAAVILTGLMVAGCAKQQGRPDQLGRGAPAASRISSSMSATACSSRPIPPELTAQARATLDKQAQWLKQL